MAAPASTAEHVASVPQQNKDKVIPRLLALGELCGNDDRQN
jgi:hypothetical protein